MKTYFLDTSALVKRYHQEVGTDIIDIILTKYGFDYALRTLDSLQLAAMESVGKEKVDGVVCADARFCEIIRLEGFHVINPEESERSTRC
jgi:hypothetical protein